MSAFARQVAEEVLLIAKESEGATFWVSTTILSSRLSLTAVDITETSTGSGELEIEDIILKTDGTGLAGGTTFQIISDNAKGTTVVLSEAIGNLGVNVTVDLENVRATEASRTGANAENLLTARTILESGKKLQVRNSDAIGTGAGQLEIFVKFRRLSDNVDIKALLGGEA